jgi:predicted regulator of Ras-like GTPase activity (Roadblock/LC7/MglB family)
MKDILEKLNKSVGVKGSMIVTSDGITVASVLGKDMDENLVAAMASNTIHNAKKALKKLEAQTFDQFVLTATYGKMVFVDVGVAFIVVVTDKEIHLDQTLIDVSSAAYRIRSLGHLNV